MIDSHCHLDFDYLANNLDKIINNSKKNNVTSILSINTNPKNFEKHLNLIQKYNGIYLSYGLHPCEIKSFNQENTLNFDDNCKISNVVGIGETGIDLYYSKDHLITLQCNF